MSSIHKKFNDFVNESNTFNQSEYLKWKRKNVTLRGIRQDVNTENGGSAMLGAGLYTAHLGNKQLAKQYGNVYFVVNARPKNPILFNNLNEWEIWFYNKLVFNYSKKKGLEYPDKRDFYANTTIEKELLAMGYDGVEIRGREVVNFTPDMDKIRYFKTEQEVKYYYESNIDTIKRDSMMDELKLFKKKMVDKYGDDLEHNCGRVSTALSKHLSKIGISNEVIWGMYKDASLEYVPNTTEWIDNDEDFDEDEFWNEYETTKENGKSLNYAHIWVETKDGYIVDLTADQFHPDEKDKYYIIYTKDRSHYLKHQ